VLSCGDDDMKKFLTDNMDLFPGLFKVSQVEMLDEPKDGMKSVQTLPLKVGVEKASGVKCPRCWNYSETVGKNITYPDLCQRCSNVMTERSHNA